MWWSGTRGWPTMVSTVKVSQRVANGGLCIRAPWTWGTQHPATPPPTARSAPWWYPTDSYLLQKSLHHAMSSCWSELFWRVSWWTSSHLPPERSQLPLPAPQPAGPQHSAAGAAAGAAAVTLCRRAWAQTHNSGNCSESKTANTLSVVYIAL